MKIVLMGGGGGISKCPCHESCMLREFPVSTHVPCVCPIPGHTVEGYRALPEEEAGSLSPSQLCFRLPGQLRANGLDGSVSSLCPPGLPLAVADLLMIYHSRALTHEGDTRDRRRQGGRHA